MSAGNYDVWTKQAVSFSSLEAGRAALRDEALLDGFFTAWTETLDKCDACKVMGCSTAAARNLPKFGVNVLMVGETGAGKSTLVKVMTGDEDIVTSATRAGTFGDERYTSPCKINWIDTPGFKLPVTPEEATNQAHTQSFFDRWKDNFSWSRWLARIRRMMTSLDLAVRPSVVVYCHRASSRIIPERLLEIWRIPHSHQIPLIVCVTDVCGIDDSALKEVRKSMNDLVRDLGKNDVGKPGTLIEINSEQKTVRGHQYKITGVKQLLEHVINDLDPLLCLQLLNRPWFSGGTHKVDKESAASSASQKRKERDEEGESSEDEASDDDEESSNASEQELVGGASKSKSNNSSASGKKGGNGRGSEGNGREGGASSGNKKSRKGSV